MPIWLSASLWGIAVGAGFLLGSIIAYARRLTHSTVATVMAFGGGVLIAVATVELMEESYLKGGFVFSAIGLLVGAVAFSALNALLARFGGFTRKRCGGCVAQPTEKEIPGSGLALALGSVLDAIPEAVAIGLSLGMGGAVGAAIVAGFFLANVPQGLSATSGMREAGRSTRFVIGLWIAVTVLSGLFAGAGVLLAALLPEHVTASVTAVAAGAVLAMLAEVVIPEAFFNVRRFVGLITVLGFLAAFVLIKMAI